LLRFPTIRSLPLAWKLIAFAWISIASVVLVMLVWDPRPELVDPILLVLTMTGVLASMAGAAAGFGGPQLRIGAVLVGLVIPVCAALLVVGIALLSQGAG